MAPSRPHLLLAAALAAAVLWIAFFANAGALGLIGPDEPRYAAVARTMAESGDWVTPRLNGQPWFEKPILYYWGAAAAFLALGDSEAAARLPSALAALLATGAMALLCFRLYGAPGAFALLLIMPTLGLLLGFAHAASTDMLFTGMLTLALALAAHILGDARTAGDTDLTPHPLPRGTPDRRRHVWWYAAWGAVLGLAVLAKGPAAVALAGGSVAVWALCTRRWTEALRLAHPATVVGFVVVALPWYVLCAWRNPDFLQVFVVEHNVQRFLTPVFEHRQPFWYFAVVLAIGLLPWTALLVPVIRDMRGWRLTDSRHHPEILAACWALVPLVVFSLSQSKLPGYILPSVPPIAWLMARVAARDASAGSSTLRRTLAVIGGGFAVLTVVAFGPLTYFSEDARLVLVDLHAPAAAPFIVVAGGVAIMVLAMRRQPWAALTLTSSLMMAILLTIGVVSVPAMDGRLTPRIAASAATAAAGNGPLYMDGMDRAWRYGLDYYTRQAIREWQGDTTGVLVTTPAREQALRNRGDHVEVLVRVSTEAVVLRVTPISDARMAK